MPRPDDLRGRAVWSLPWIVLIGASISALLIVAAPAVPHWGVHHTPHLDKPSLRLNPGQTIEQTFQLEHDRPDTVLLWIDRRQPVPSTGALAITIRRQENYRSVTVPFADVLPSGTILVPFTPPPPWSAGTAGSITVSLADTTRPVFLLYQIGETIYQGGELRHSGRPTAKGDLAFRVRYSRKPFGYHSITLGLAAATLLAGAITALALRRPSTKQGMERTPEEDTPGTQHDGQTDTLRGSHRSRSVPRSPWSGSDLRNAVLVGLPVACFYALFLLRPGLWIAPDDFTKDVTYLEEGGAALQAGAWPEWAHARCGGLPLLGNPESNILSFGTLFATILPAHRALELLLALEAGVGVAGAFLLARVLGLPTAGATAAALTTGLAGTYAYRLAEGWAMLGGAVAFLPLAAAFLGAAFQTRDRRWAVASGLSLTASFYRGDLHLVVGILLLFFLWALAEAPGRRRSGSAAPVRRAATASAWPLGAFLIAGIVFTFFGLPKVLAYLEGPSIIPPSLPPYAAPLLRDGIADDILVRTPPAATPVRFLHAEQSDRWGAVGSPVGPVALLLAFLGLLTKKHPAWRSAALLTGAGFALSEGTLFETVIRHGGVMATLLRIPSKLLLITLPFFGILVGIGFTRLFTTLGWRPPRPAVALAALSLTLAIPTGRILALEFAPRTPVVIQRPGEPTLTPSGPRTGDPADTPAVRANAGYLLPWLCTEPFAQPPFTRQITQAKPMADVPVVIGPNRISLRVGAPPAEVRILTRYGPGWQTNRGVLVDEPDGALRLLAPREEKPEVTLQYRTATRTAQVLLVGLFLLTVALLLAPRVRRSLPKAEHRLDDDVKTP